MFIAVTEITYINIKIRFYVVTGARRMKTKVCSSVICHRCLIAELLTLVRSNAVTAPNGLCLLQYKWTIKTWTMNSLPLSFSIKHNTRLIYTLNAYQPVKGQWSICRCLTDLTWPEVVLGTCALLSRFTFNEMKTWQSRSGAGDENREIHGGKTVRHACCFYRVPPMCMH